MNMEIRLVRHEPIPTPPPTISISREFDSNKVTYHREVWNLTLEEAELMHSRLGQVLYNYFQDLR